MKSVITVRKMARAASMQMAKMTRMARMSLESPIIWINCHFFTIISPCLAVLQPWSEVCVQAGLTDSNHICHFMSHCSAAVRHVDTCVFES